MTTTPAATETQPARRSPGILCPRCGLKLFMRRTQPRRDNSVRRIRKCPQCDYRCVTFERVKETAA